MNYLGTLVNNQLNTHIRVDLKTVNSLLLMYMSIFMSVSYCIIIVAFKVKTRKHEFFKYVLPCKDCLGYSGSLYSYMNFKIRLLISVKKKKKAAGIFYED